MIDQGVCRHVLIRDYVLVVLSFAGANGGQASKQIMYANVSASIQKRKDSQGSMKIQG